MIDQIYSKSTFFFALSSFSTNLRNCSSLVAPDISVMWCPALISFSNQARYEMRAAASRIWELTMPEKEVKNMRFAVKQIKAGNHNSELSNKV